MTEDDTQWRDRAHAAEAELTALRTQIRDYVRDLRTVTRGGPVTYRRAVAEALIKILDT